MFTKSAQYTPQVDDPGTVQLQFLDRRPPRWSQSQYQRIVWIPSEMGSPGLLPRMVKRNGLPGDGISGPNADVFPIVAPLTGEGEI